MKRFLNLLFVIFVGVFFISASVFSEDEKMRDIEELDLGVKTKDIRIKGAVKPDLNFGKFPLYFIANKGQVNKKAKFYAKASRYTLWLTGEGLVFDSTRKFEEGKQRTEDRRQIGDRKNETYRNPYSPHSPRSPKLERDVSRLIFLNANKNPGIVPIEESKLKVNYFIGNDRSKWHCDVPTSQAVLYKKLYKNIDLKVYGIEKQIEYDWIVKPGGNPGDIRFEYKNVKGTRIDNQGNLIIETDFGELIHKKPISYQEIGNEKVIVNAAFKKLDNVGNTYGFEVANYDKRFKLIIDPVVLAYSTYLGGQHTDIGHGISVDNNGNAYVVGATISPNFPTQNQYQTHQGNYEAFVTKINTTQSGASSLIYSTYLGGYYSDYGYGIAVDSSGYVYVTGSTGSSDFPTLNQYQTYQGSGDVFVTKIDTTQTGASSLIYSTYLGGGHFDWGNEIAADNSGNAYVTGETWSTNFPTRNQYQTDPGASDPDAFVTKIDTTQTGASSLIYSTYLGGGVRDSGYGIAVYSNGNAYVTGATTSTDYPILNQYQTYHRGNRDAFLTIIDTTQAGTSSFIYSTYLGGGGNDSGFGIAVDRNGNVFISGQTNSTDFPTLNQYQTYQGNYDAFVTKIDTTQTGVSSLIYSTYLGGGGWDEGKDIALDGSGYAYVTGWTSSTDYPILNQYQTFLEGGRDVIVTKIDTIQGSISSLIYSTYLGGGDWDHGKGIAVDSSGNAYVTGNTDSWDFPTLNQCQANQPVRDVFFTKIIGGILPTVITTPVFSITTTTAESGGEVTSEGEEGSAVTARGVCWSTSPNPSISDNFTTDGTGTGAFTSSITGLTPNTTYYVRAYATNIAGTAFGNQITFTTSIPDNPTISGTVSDGANPIGGVTITFSHDGHTETTDVNGYYSYTVPYGTTTTVIPGKPGYGSWIPAGKTFTNITSDKTQNFVGSMVICTISGTVTDGTNPIKGVTITFSHDGHTETTDADGYYAYTLAYGTSTTVTASKPGYTFTPSQYSYANLTVDQPQQDFTVLNSIFVTITNPHDGDIVSRNVMIAAEVSVTETDLTAAQSNQLAEKVEFYIDGVLEKQDNRAPYKHRWNTRLYSNGNHTITAKAYHSSGLTHQHEITLNVQNSTAPPHIFLNRERLNFGLVIGDSRTGSQVFLISNSGGSTLNWNASVSDTWMQVSPLSGTADMIITVSMDAAGLTPGSYTGNIIITDPNADNSPAVLSIYLEVKEEPREVPPFGSFDSPVDGSVVSGSIPITGWALDDVEVSNVKVFRNPLEGHEIEQIYIGDAIFVDDARPDVEGKFSIYPRHYQAGWGYMMLTNRLPNQGNGTFVFTAVAMDSSGNEITLGEKTIICDNANAVKPFGAIDTPTQGGDADGTEFINFGWALTPKPNTIKKNGSTIKVWLDGVPLEGNPVYNRYRKDVAALFPGYNNGDEAGGYYYLDTTLYANGVHTIAWSVTDNAGNTDGIGSRYFNVMNVNNPSATSASTFIYGYRHQDKFSIEHLPAAVSPVYLKKGYKVSKDQNAYYPGSDGIITIEIKEEERIEIHNAFSRYYFGYMVVGDQLKPLPIGSFLDTGRGIFYWQPGVGFIGKYRLVFIEKKENGEFKKRHINVIIHPKY